MEVVIIEKRVFEELLSYAHSLSERMNNFCSQYEKGSLDKWLDGQDICLLLNISPRTLQTMRGKSQIGYTQINRKIYYKSEDVEKLLKQQSLITK